MLIRLQLVGLIMKQQQQQQQQKHTLTELDIKTPTMSCLFGVAIYGRYI